MSESTQDRVAIVGLGGVFPGAASIAEFWRNVAAGKDAGRHVTSDHHRWALSPERALQPGGPQPDRVYSTWACLLDELPPVDPAWKIDRDVLAELDPLFRIGLWAAMAAWRDAGEPSVDPERAGVILGHIVLPTESTSGLARDALLSQFARQQFDARISGPDPQRWSKTNWSAAGAPPALIAGQLGIRGPVYTLDAACASSLYALKLASDELLAQRADVMLAGGLSRPDCQYTQMGFAQLQALTKSGRCAPLSKAADGLVVGEGAGIFVLKRLSDALRDGDRIYATFAGFGLSNDRGANLLAPRSEGQLRAMRAAYQQAGWRPGDVDLIECHATGTPIGDGVELDSLHQLWAEESGPAGRCVLGSVKSNVGHLLTAAGAASLMKILGAFHHGQRFPTANYVEPANGLARPESPFTVLRTAETWRQRRESEPRRAAINAFGFGGINAHVLVEEFLPPSGVCQPPDSTRKTNAALHAPPSFSTSQRDDVAKLCEGASRVEPLTTRNQGVGTPRSEGRIAIVGVGVHVGSATTFSELARSLITGEPDQPPRATSGWGIEPPSNVRGHAIDEVTVGVDEFRIPPVELEEMLPQQQLMLQVAARALDDAAVPRDQGDRTGVFVGISLDPQTTNFHCRWMIEERAAEWAAGLGKQLSESELAEWTRALKETFGPPLTPNRVMGNLGGIVASRLAREFDVGGPSFTLSSDETSGLRALGVATRALQRGELDRAIVGAIDFPSDIRRQLALSEEASMLHACAGVSSAADGPDEPGGKAEVRRWKEEGKPNATEPLPLPSHFRLPTSALIAGPSKTQTPAPTDLIYTDAAVAFILERYDEAIPAGRHVYACLDEFSSSIESTTAGVLDHFDRVQELRPVGNCGAVTGLVGVLRELAAMNTAVLPEGAGRPDRAHPVSQQFWLRDRSTEPRTAAITMQAATGDLSKVTVAEPVGGVMPTSPSVIRGSGFPELFVCAGDTVAEVVDAVRACLEFARPSVNLTLAARDWWQTQPPQASKRLAAVFVGTTLDELRDDLARFVHDPREAMRAIANPARIFWTPEPFSPAGKLAFVFPGSGNHFLGMGRELLATFPQVLQRQDHENLRLRSQFQPDLIWNGESTADIGEDHKAMIFGQVALGTAICDWLTLFGVKPDVAIGYSLGESAALFGLRAWTARDEMLARMEASPLFGSDLTAPFDAARQTWNIPADQAVPWLSGAIDRGADAVLAAIARYPRAYLLIVNTPTQCVIGGDRGQIEAVVRDLKANFVQFSAPSTVHCEILKAVAPAYTALHQMETTPPADVTFYSSASGQAYPLSRDSAAAAILAQAVGTVDFPRVVRNAYKAGVRLLVEIGPGASCTRMIDEILIEQPHRALAVCPVTANPIRQALTVLAELVAHRVPVDLAPLYNDIPAASHPPRTRTVTTRTQGSAFARARGGYQPPVPPVVASAPIFAPNPHIAPLRTPAPRISVTDAQGADAPRSPGGLHDFESWMTERLAAHEAFLRFSSEAQRVAADIVKGGRGKAEGGRQTASPSAAPTVVARTSSVVAQPSPLLTPLPARPTPQPAPSPALLPPSAFRLPPSSLSYEQCLEFAIGSIGKALGPKFAEIDSFPTRVRLPDVPLMLVDRILEIEGEPLSMTRGRVVTEHDIHPDAWYLDCGKIPTCLAVESGQADLFLSGWLGIDLQTRGLAMYRLLDAVVTFHAALPGPGKTIHYDIKINNFFQQGDTYLFRFEFDATVDGEPLLTMRDGVAGFFTPEALAAGQGVVHTPLDKQPRPGKRPADWVDPIPMTVESYDDAQLAKLRAGDIVGCFGEQFSRFTFQRPVTLPDGRLNLVHRVLKLDPTAGKYGLGQIRAEADIHPDDWFLTCHFCDDQVMPGTLMYECCLHTLRIYLLRMGWIGEAGTIAYEPVPGVKSRLKCRGQVLASTQRVWYEVTIKELGYDHTQRRPGIVIPGLPAGAPYCIADALMYADGKPIVEITDMSVRLVSLETRAQSLEPESTPARSSSPALNPQPSTLNPLFDTDRITAFAIGKPSDAFGDRYRIFDEERKIARLPGPPFQFLDRIMSIENCRPWELAAGGEIVAEYDVPSDAWYFDANRTETMPFAVLLETALQPCGWLAGYLGSALTSEIDLSFRNLGGKATQYRPVTRTSGTLTTNVKITRVSQSGGMIIQHFDYDLRCNGEPVYVGNTYFGFFSKASLANQIGIPNAPLYQMTADEQARARSFPIPLDAPFPDDNFCMVRRVDAFVKDGGPQGLGYIRGSVDVDPSMWFFKAHFYQDPVWPGSLGLESFLQLLRLYAADRWAGEGLGLRAKGLGPEKTQTDPASLPINHQPSTINPTLSLSPQHLALSLPHEWVYRGQVIPTDKTVTVEAVINAVDDAARTLTASGFLTVDGRVIYQMIKFGWSFGA